MATTEVPGLDPIRRLTRDLKKAAATLSAAEARYLVDAYYILQRDRIRAANQVRALTETSEPHDVIMWLADNAEILESNVKRALGAYSQASLVGEWAESIVGIGPVISAGLLAHIDITKAPSVGHIWRFAGLDPTVKWEKKTKRPWNAALKRLCWLTGESFVKVSGHEDDVYGKLYLYRKAIEEKKNAAGDFAAQAAAALVEKKWKDDTLAKAAYDAGRLPQARIHLRAKRWAVKIFLAHWHAVAYRAHFNQDAPKPYVLTHLEHVDEIKVPNWPF
jgi:Transposase IS116/IS110/IS902 family